ncbi:DUF6338 family protein, partial [Enterobacter roggenkampii]
MDIWDTNKLVIFIAFVIPGFLSMKLYSVLHPNVQLDTSKTVIEVVTYSCINYAIWLIPIYLFEKSQYGATHLITYMLFYLCVLFVREGANKQVISSQADSLIKISRIWA